MNESFSSTPLPFRSIKSSSQTILKVTLSLISPLVLFTGPEEATVGDEIVGVGGIVS